MPGEHTFNSGSLLFQPIADATGLPVDRVRRQYQKLEKNRRHVPFLTHNLTTLTDKKPRDMGRAFSFQP